MGKYYIKIIAGFLVISGLSSCGHELNVHPAHVGNVSSILEIDYTAKEVNGKWIQDRHAFNDSTVYDLDERGLVIRVTYYHGVSGDQRTEYMREKDGRIRLATNFNADGPETIEKTVEFVTNSMSEIKVYDNVESLENIIHRHHGEGFSVDTIINPYSFKMEAVNKAILNEKGWETKLITFFRGHESDVTIKYLEVDEKGNWTKRIKHAADKIITSREYRYIKEN